jgi:hypothetical protein
MLGEKSQILANMSLYPIDRTRQNYVYSRRDGMS